MPPAAARRHRALFGPESLSATLARFTSAAVSTYVILGLLFLYKAVSQGVARGIAPWQPTVALPGAYEAGLETPMSELALSWADAPMTLALIAIRANLLFLLGLVAVWTLHEVVSGMARFGPFSAESARWVRRLGIAIAALPVTDYLLGLMTLPGVSHAVQRYAEAGLPVEMTSDYVVPPFQGFAALLPLGFLVWLLGGLLHEGASLQQQHVDTV